MQININNNSVFKKWWNEQVSWVREKKLIQLKVSDGLAVNYPITWYYTLSFFSSICSYKSD